MQPDLLHTLALSLGASWAAGINLYAAVLTLGLSAALGYTQLPPELGILSDPLVILAAGFMYFVEFFADKTPGVDTGWDALHTFIRIPAGALLAAGAASGFDVAPAAQLAAGLVGGGIAAGSHFTKAGTRVMINTSPEPVTNWIASVTEDLSVLAGLWAALHHPWVFLALFGAFILVMIWLLPRLWRALKALFRRIGGWFGKGDAKPSVSGEDP